MQYAGVLRDAEAPAASHRRLAAAVVSGQDVDSGDARGGARGCGRRGERIVRLLLGQQLGQQLGGLGVACLGLLCELKRWLFK